MATEYKRKIICNNYKANDYVYYDKIILELICCEFYLPIIYSQIDKA